LTGAKLAQLLQVKDDWDSWLPGDKTDVRSRTFLNAVLPGGTDTGSHSISGWWCDPNGIRGFDIEVHAPVGRPLAGWGLGEGKVVRISIALAIVAPWLP
jgi:hypothetical protein